LAIYPVVVVFLSWPAETRKAAHHIPVLAVAALHNKQYFEICHGLYVDHSKFKVQLGDLEVVECNYTERHPLTAVQLFPSITKLQEIMGRQQTQTDKHTVAGQKDRSSSGRPT